jgi:hypothetical protein
MNRREFITLLGGLGVSDLNIEIKRSNGWSPVLLLVHPGNPDREQAREGEGGQWRQVAGASSCIVDATLYPDDYAQAP